MLKEGVVLTEEKKYSQACKGKTTVMSEAESEVLQRNVEECHVLLGILTISEKAVLQVSESMALSITCLQNLDSRYS